MGTYDRRRDLEALLGRATEGLCLRDLAARLDVSKNTAQRDVDALTRAGVPIRERRSGQRLFFTLAAPRLDPSPVPNVLHEAGTGPATSVDVVLAVESGAEARVVTRLRDAFPARVRLVGGRLHARITCREEALVGWILSWAGVVELASPANLRRRVRLKAEALAAQHGPNPLERKVTRAA